MRTTVSLGAGGSTSLVRAFLRASKGMNRACSGHGSMLARAVLLALVITAAAALAPPPSPKLRFREDGTFTIAQLTDMHYGQGERSDGRTDQVQAAVLAAEQLDLVAFSGDQASGFAWDGSPGWLEQRWRRLLQPSLQAGVPHASILGNHDGEAGLRRREIVELDRRLGGALTLTQAGPRYLFGAGNYFLDVHNATGDEVAARIWFLDSGNLGCEGLTDGWGCVPEGTVAWVEEQAARLPRVPSSLAFIHIPLPQFMELWNTQPTSGHKGEPVACPLRDTGVFAALRRLGIQAIYSGHDHLSDFQGVLQGVRLAYGRKSGHANYGPAGALGARIIQLRQGQSAAQSATWIRTKDGRRVEQAGGVLLPAQKRLQRSCGAHGWLVQRLYIPAMRAAFLYCALAGLALVAVTATVTTLAVRACLQGSRKAPLGAGSEEEQQAFLRSIPPSSPVSV